MMPRWGIQHMHIRGGKSDILGPKKTETMFMIFSDTKHRLTDILGLLEAILTFICIV